MKNIIKLIYENNISNLISLGIGFTLAASIDSSTSILMGITILIVSTISSLIIVLSNNIINEKYHIILYLLIISMLVSIIQIIFNKIYPNIINKLGVHFSALCVSAVPYRLARKVTKGYNIKEIVILSLILGILFIIIMLLNSLLINVFKSILPILNTHYGPYFFLPLIIIIINTLNKIVMRNYERNYINYS